MSSCAHCGTTCTRHCGNCHAAAYCGVPCQEAHYEEHKDVCIPAEHLFSRDAVIELRDFVPDHEPLAVKMDQFLISDSVEAGPDVRVAFAQYIGEKTEFKKKAGNWFKRQVFAVQIWGRMRAAKGIENITNEISEGLYDEEPWKLRVIRSVAGRSRKFNSIKTLASYRLGQLGG